jgi:FtsH-binding integral membrane protein
MQKNTKIAITIAGVGLALNQYEKSKISDTKTYLENDEWQLQFFGGLAAIGGGISAIIFERYKDNDKAKKIAFIGLGGVAIAGFASLLYALKKMT